MNLAEIESKVLALSEEERRQFAAWFYQHQDEIAGNPDEEIEDDLDPEQRAELMRRVKEIEDNPDLLIPFSLERFDAICQRFADERAQRTSAHRE